MRPSRAALLMAAVFATTACSDEAPVSGPGTVTAALVGPNASDGAALIVLVGEGVGEITATGGTDVYTRAGETSTQIVLINQAGGELAFQVALADTTALPEAVVQEVAGPDDELREQIAEYSIEFRQ